MSDSNEETESAESTVDADDEDEDSSDESECTSKKATSSRRPEPLLNVLGIRISENMEFLISPPSLDSSIRGTLSQCDFNRKLLQMRTDSAFLNLEDKLNETIDQADAYNNRELETEVKLRMSLVEDLKYYRELHKKSRNVLAENIIKLEKIKEARMQVKNLGINIPSIDEKNEHLTPLPTLKDLFGARIKK